MASCMALKRSFDHDRDNSSSPFENRTASSSTKRRRYFPVTVVSASPPPNNTTTSTTMGNDNNDLTTFPDVQPILSTDALLTRIKEEVRRLQRRHQLKPASSTAAASATSQTSDLSDEETNSSQESKQQEARASSNSAHLLTLKQVNMICARLLKEREDKIREEYDQILSNKLHEQYEGFVRFTQDQLTRRFSELQFSYVS